MMSAGPSGVGRTRSTGNGGVSRRAPGDARPETVCGSSRFPRKLVVWVAAAPSAGADQGTVQLVSMRWLMVGGYRPRRGGLETPTVVRHMDVKMGWRQKSARELHVEHFRVVVCHRLLVLM